METVLDESRTAAPGHQAAALRRPTTDRRLFVFASLAIAAALGAIAWYLATSTTLALPVRVRVSGLTPKGEMDLRLLVVDDRQAVKLAGRLGSFVYFDGFWAQEMALRLPRSELANVHEVTVTIGDVSRQFSRTQVHDWPRQTAHATDVALIVSLPHPDSALPFLKNRATSLNWPGDWEYLGAVCKHSAVPIVIVLALAFWLRTMRSAAGRDWSLNVLGLGPARPPCGGNGTARANAVWNWTAVAFLTAAIALLEIMEPYYFTQGDTVGESFPMILVGCRDVWRGEVPDYNPHLLFGQPLLSTGMYALSYPPLYLAYAFARHVLAQEYLTIEVFAVLHLMVGFLVMRLLGATLGMSAMTANLAALCMCLSGASLIIGRSWFQFIPLVVWPPVLFLGLVRLLDRPVGWPWVVGMGISLAMPFHVGFSQPALYLGGLFGVACLYLTATRRLAGRQWCMVLAAVLVGAGLSLPLVYQQWLLVRSSSRFPVSNDGLAESLPCLLFPYPLVQGRVASGWGNENVHLLGHVYFFGGLFGFLLIFQAAGLLAARLVKLRPAPEVQLSSHGAPGSWHGQLWTFLALFVVWFGLGDAAGLWKIASSLPVIGMINRTPLRVMPFLVFFACLAGGLTLERLLGRARQRRRCELLVAGSCLMLLVLHVSYCRTSFHHVHYRPFPALPRFMERRFREDGQLTGRVSNWGPFSRNETYGLILAQNTPAVHDLPTLHGINPVIEGTPICVAAKQRVLTRPLPALRAYGARWFLMQSADRLTEPGTNLTMSWRTDASSKEDVFNGAVTLADMRRVDEEDGVILYEVPGCDPLAFVGAPTGPRSLPLSLKGDGVDVDVSSLAESQHVVVNFLRYPDEVMHARLDGKRAPLLTDAWNRIIVQVPARSKLLSIRYAPAWRTGIIAGLLVVGLGLALAYVSLDKRRCRPIEVAMHGRARR